MKYVLVLNATVVEIIPEIDPNFSKIPLTERYSASFLAGCIVVPDDTEVFAGYIYDAEAGTFSIPPELPVPEGPGIVPGTPTPTPQQDTDSLLVDHEYRLTLLELGVN